MQTGVRARDAGNPRRTCAVVAGHAVDACGAGGTEGRWTVVEVVAQQVDRSVLGK